ncbi:MAG: hypothetical protein ACOH1H_01765 [Brevundimonas sp.]|jgi:hypothetical protein
MADGDLTLKLDRYASEKLAKKAKAAGMSPEDLATSLLSAQLFDYDDFTWPEGGDPRTAIAEPVIEDGARDWDEVRPELEAYLEEKLKARR